MMVQSREMSAFNAIRRPVVGCVEHYSCRNFIHCRLVLMEDSTRYMFMTLTRGICSPELFRLPDGVSKCDVSA